MMANIGGIVSDIEIEEGEARGRKSLVVDRCDGERWVFRRWTRMRRWPCLVENEAPLACPSLREGWMDWISEVRGGGDTERGRNEQVPWSDQDSQTECSSKRDAGDDGDCNRRINQHIDPFFRIKNTVTGTTLDNERNACLPGGTLTR